jgi:phosphonate transport system substrate-binding protein
VTIPAKVTFGLVPATDVSDARVALADLCAALADATGVSVQPHRAPSPEALASVREGVAAYHSALFVDERSPIHAVSSLKNVRAAWVSPTSAAGYLVPRIALARRGLDLRRVFTSETFYKSHHAAAAAVLEGHADVGATFAVFRAGDPHEPLVRAGFDGVGGGPRPRVIDVTGPVPADMVVCQTGVPYAVRARIARALRALADDPPMRGVIAKLFGADGFVDFEPAVLQSVKDIVSAGRQLAVA